MDVWFPLNNPIKPCPVLDKFVDTLLRPIIPFTEETNVKNRTFLVAMDVMSLDTNIPQNETQVY